MTPITSRFAPNPNLSSGHLGHVKSMVINFELHPKCECILRLDDTNPETDTLESVNNIISDVTWLGYTPHKITYTSDYFPTLHKYAVLLTRHNKCYVDFSPTEQMSDERHNGINSKYRDTSPEHNLMEFENMRKGKYTEGECVLRMKIDMQNNNHTLRDPVAYRIKYTHIIALGMNGVYIHHMISVMGLLMLLKI